MGVFDERIFLHFKSFVSYIFILIKRYYTGICCGFADYRFRSATLKLIGCGVLWFKRQAAWVQHFEHQINQSNVTLQFMRNELVHIFTSAYGCKQHGKQIIFISQVTCSNSKQGTNLINSSKWGPTSINDVASMHILWFSKYWLHILKVANINSKQYGPIQAMMWTYICSLSPIQAKDQFLLKSSIIHSHDMKQNGTHSKVAYIWIWTNSHIKVFQAMTWQLDSSPIQGMDLVSTIILANTKNRTGPIAKKMDWF